MSKLRPRVESLSFLSTPEGSQGLAAREPPAALTRPDAHAVTPDRPEGVLATEVPARRGETPPSEVSATRTGIEPATEVPDATRGAHETDVAAVAGGSHQNCPALSGRAQSRQFYFGQCSFRF